MEDKINRSWRENRQNRIREITLLCAAGLLINFLGVRLALGLNLPLFLDNLGTVLTAAIGGLIPGIIVGFLTNIVNGINDYTTTYYGSLSVLIAVFASVFAEKGYFKKLIRFPIPIITFALIGGGLGSILTWALYGLSFGEGISAPLAHQIYNTGTFSVFWAQFFADMLIDLGDKIITVLFTALVLHLLPQTFLDSFYYSGWQQAPMSKYAKAGKEDGPKNRISLRTKITLLVAVGLIITGAGVTLVSFIHFRNAAIEEQTLMAKGIAYLAADLVDAERVDEYIELGEQAEGYTETKQQLGKLIQSADSIEFVYVYRILEDGCHVVFDPDTAELTGEPAGAIVEFDEAFLGDLPKLLAGEEIEPIIADGQYGYLLTVYEPVYDSDGVCQCYAAVDINMEKINVQGYQFLARVIALFFGFFVLILSVTLWMAEYNIILPIDSMAAVTMKANYETPHARKETLDQIHELDICTGDEIENLYHSEVNNAETNVRNIENMERQNEIISKLQSGLILVLADLVESRDKNTGDHVNKTADYTRIIMQQLRKNGVYTDQLTDEFIEDVVHSAPLHDVGKIKVPDAILNKPGKLTSEEFNEIKKHTTAGHDIITSAMDMVSEESSGYLNEARNLAYCHHEKWNGTGYPQHLAGEEIPLSARIMAVADVFDALVSRRSYKEPMTFEKAMEIIREGSGTHFDPYVVEAFLQAEDEVRKVAERHKNVFASEEN